MLLYKKFVTYFEYPVLWFTFHSLEIYMHAWNKAVSYQKVGGPDWNGIEYITEEHLFDRAKFKRELNESFNTCIF